VIDLSGTESAAFGPRLQRHPLEPVLRIPAALADLGRRGVTPADPVRARHLREIALTFIAGCNLMYLDRPLDRLAALVSATDPARRGFVLEGAAMGAAIRDALSVTGSLLRLLRQDFGSRYDYLISVGAGWAMARTPWRTSRIARSLDPLLVALACDGRGFHDLYFNPARARTGRIGRYRGALAGNYDAGLGRALWFVGSGHPPTVLDHVAAFAPKRHGDLYAGLGLAMAYAGPATPQDWTAMLASAGPQWRNLGQGICFAAEALRQGGGIPANAEAACRHVLGLEGEAAAAIARTTRPAAGGTDAYEAWRTAIRTALPPQAEARS